MTYNVDARTKFSFVAKVYAWIRIPSHTSGSHLENKKRHLRYGLPP